MRCSEILKRVFSNGNLSAQTSSKISDGIPFDESALWNREETDIYIYIYIYIYTHRYIEVRAQVLDDEGHKRGRLAAPAEATPGRRPKITVVLLLLSVITLLIVIIIVMLLLLLITMITIITYYYYYYYY